VVDGGIEASKPVVEQFHDAVKDRGLTTFLADVEGYRESTFVKPDTTPDE